MALLMLFFVMGMWGGKRLYGAEVVSCDDVRTYHCNGERS